MALLSDVELAYSDEKRGVLSKVFGFLFSNRLHIVAYGPGTIAFWNQWMNLPIDFLGYLILFLVVWFGYVVNMYYDYQEDLANSEITRSRFTNHTESTKWLAIALAVSTLVLAYSHRPKYALLVMASLSLAALYSLPIQLKTITFRMKENYLFKNSYSAFNWSVVLFALALFYGQSLNITSQTILFCSICFFMTFFVELLWDIRDAEGDAKAGINTIAVRFGADAAIKILHAINVTTLALALYGMYENLLSGAFILVAVHTVFAAFFLQWYRQSERKRLASHVYVVIVAVELLIISVVDWVLKSSY